MQLPYRLTINLDGFEQSKTITINSGKTILVGANGAGKTQLLRGIKMALGNDFEGRKVRFISAGRLAQHENYRSDYDGHRNSQPLYESAEFGEKNSQNRRHQIETALGDYQTLGIRPDIQIKVAERLRKLFNRDFIIEWDAGYLKIKFTHLDDGKYYSSGREASGLLHLVALLTAIYNDEISVLIIDEPEVSLHPQLQSFLLQEINNAAGNPNDPQKKLIIYATHSTEMIDIKTPTDLCDMVFCHDINSYPNQINPDAGELQNKKLKVLLSRMGQEHKLTFFSKRPLLVEGPSDSLICSSLDKHLGIYLEPSGSQILPVIGKGQMPIVAKLMKLLGKTPIVLTDADSFTDDITLTNYYLNDPTANEIAQNLGFSDALTFGRTVYGDFSQLVEMNWNDIQEYAEQENYWIKRDTDKVEYIHKRRAAFTFLISNDLEKFGGISNRLHWMAMKNRLLALLNLLEDLGCFVLRKGTIESYYEVHNIQDKVFSAVEEIEQFTNQDPSLVAGRYSDLVRALLFASKTKLIDEAMAIRELVLSVAAPALAILDEKTNDSQLNQLVRRILLDKSSLFELRTSGNNELVIELKTQILDIKGFPLRIRKESNLNNEVNKQLGLDY